MQDIACQPRAIGALRIGAGARGLTGLRQSGALKALFPRVPRGAPMQAILINTAGGITGGDRFRVEAGAGPGAHLSLTTQAAERVYRAQPGQTGLLHTRLSVAAGARIDWLPQETILYEAGALSRRLEVTLAPGARFLMAEPLVFGRRAMGEVLHSGHLRDRIEITRDGRLLYRDAMTLTGDLARLMARPATGAAAGAMASVVFVSGTAEAMLGPIRAALPDTAGASLIGADVLVLRALAEDSFALRQTLLPVLDRLTENSLPTSWRL